MTRALATLLLSLLTSPAQTLHLFRHDHGVTLSFSHTNTGQFTLYAGTNAYLEAPTNNWYRSFQIMLPTDKPMAIYSVRSPGAPIVEGTMVYLNNQPAYGPWPSSVPVPERKK